MGIQERLGKRQGNVSGAFRGRSRSHQVSKRVRGPRGRFGATLAVSRYKDNEVVKEIVMGINSEDLLTIVDNDMLNPACTAALFGNTEAFKIMLASKLNCLFTATDLGFLPIHCALQVTEIETFLYLFKEMKSNKVEYGKLFRDQGGIVLLYQVIDKGLIDVAYELINDYPSLATKLYEGKSALECIIEKPELFYSGTHYNLFERFVYSLVPIDNKSLGSTNTADVENQETPKKDKHRRRCLHDVFLTICFKFWETTLLHVPHIRRLKDDKVKHKKTIKLLRLICEEADKRCTERDIKRLFRPPFCLAVENNTVEALDVLTTYFKGLYNPVEGEPNIHVLTVLNRSEKVYSFIRDHHRNARSNFAAFKDNDDNNILHLAGCLAPIHKLNAASGAALQMQRELQWFEMSLFL